MYICLHYICSTSSLLLNRCCALNSVQCRHVDGALTPEAMTWGMAKAMDDVDSAACRCSKLLANRTSQIHLALAPVLPMMSAYFSRMC